MRRRFSPSDQKDSCQDNIIIVPSLFIDMYHILFTFAKMQDFLVVKGNDAQ